MPNPALLGFQSVEIQASARTRAYPFREQRKTMRHRDEIVHKLTELKAPALVGELMSEHWEPLCVTDVRATMRSIGLMPVGSATLVENYDSFVLGHAALKTLAAIADLDARELARDFLIDQFFRRDVFARDGRALDDNERRSQLLAAFFALTRPSNTIGYTMETPAGHLRYSNPTARNVVAALAGGPRPLVPVSVQNLTSLREMYWPTLWCCRLPARCAQ